MLNQFILRHFVRADGARTKFIDLLDAFRESLPKRDRRSWTRARLAAELGALGFQVGIDATNTAWILGIGPQEAERWRLEGGRVVNA